MNFGLKSRTFNLTTTPSVNPGVALETALEAGARILGVVLSITAAGTAIFGLYASVAGVDTAIANGDCTTVGSNKIWWSGIPAQHKDSIVLQAGPAADTINGFLPMAMPAKWVDSYSNATYDLKLQIITTIGGQAIVYYTVDPPNCYGETA